ncbi:MAG: hypothetical protein J7M19_00445 [Planctomycetes bacterium]|nr:hypothetical protein [Planctomycetota bacterium]
MKLFDFSLFVGNPPTSSAEGTLEQLQAYLDEADAGGVMASLAGAYYDFAAGNCETLEIAAGDRRLLPAMTLDPRRLEAALVDFAVEADRGYRALVLFPSIQKWTLSHPALETLLSGAEEARLPIVLQVARNTPVDAIAEVAAKVDVPVVACGISYASLGEVAAVAKRAGNLVFGIRLFAGLDNIETLALRLGAERLVFDSGEAVSSHVPVLEVLEAVVMSRELKGLIAVGNARRIFGGEI